MSKRKAKKKNPGGRPKYEPSDEDRAKVRLYSGMGVAKNDLCAMLGITFPTFKKHFALELRLGPIEANAKVAASLYRAATDKEKPNVVASIFWLKARAGWVEAQANRAPPRMVLPPMPGKKEQAQAAAKTAQQGTDWNDLLPQPASGTVQ